VLADQECAAALMWTCVTIVYLIPAVILTTRLLSQSNSHIGVAIEKDFPGRATAWPKHFP